MTARAARAPQLPPLLDVRVLEELLVELSDEPVPTRVSVVPETDVSAPPPGVPAPGGVHPLDDHPESSSGDPSPGSPGPDDGPASRGAPAPGRGQAPAGSPRPAGAPPPIPIGSRASARPDLRASTAHGDGVGLDHALTAGETACIDFLRFFVDLWPTRWERLRDAVHADDRDASLDSCLSVKSSSAMVGALRLSAAAGRLERAIRAGDAVSSRALLAEVQETGEQSMDAMRAWIRAQAGGRSA